MKSQNKDMIKFYLKLLGFGTVLYGVMMLLTAQSLNEGISFQSFAYLVGIGWIIQVIYIIVKIVQEFKDGKTKPPINKNDK